MRFVIRKGSLSGNLFLTASYRRGRLDKAKIFTERQADQMAGKLATNNYGIFDLGHAKCMVKDNPRVKAAITTAIICPILPPRSPGLGDMPGRRRGKASQPIAMRP